MHPLHQDPQSMAWASGFFQGHGALFTTAVLDQRLALVRRGSPSDHLRLSADNHEVHSMRMFLVGQWF